ncbi:MAG: putative porin [Owenweeksia sp.]|nr:putative porin [Owenweeksia sp.]
MRQTIGWATKRGQSFNLYHTQNITKNWNFFINYNSLNALGNYTHNRNKGFSFLANTHYKNDKAGYELYAYYMSDKLEIDEFGGIQNDSVFEANPPTATPRVLMRVNLSQDQRVMRRQQVYLKQSINLLELFGADDDSLSLEDKENADEGFLSART